MTKQEHTILNRTHIKIDNKFLFLYRDDLGDCIHIELNSNKPNNAGMQILYSKDDRTFEVSEFQAGQLRNELHIYTETKSFNKAIRSLLKGNYRTPKWVYV